MDHIGHDHIDHDHSIHTHFTKDGHIAGTSFKNILGGKDYWDSHGVMKGFTSKNVFGGHDYHDANGNHMGMTMPHHGHDNFLGNDGHFTHAPSLLHSNSIGMMRSSLLDQIR